MPIECNTTFPGLIVHDNNIISKQQQHIKKVMREGRLFNHKTDPNIQDLIQYQYCHQKQKSYKLYFIAYYIPTKTCKVKT
jgi:hypothetical protein